MNSFNLKEISATIRNHANVSDLIALHKVLVKHVKTLQRIEAFRAQDAFVMGDTVQFRARNGMLKKGTITKFNTTTTQVDVNGVKWKVHNKLLQKAID